MICFNLTKYLKPSKVFIETGTEHGNGVKKALEAGYTEIHTIELAPNLYLGNVDKFWYNKNVHLYSGSSLDVLPIILKYFEKPVTIWLDAHVDNNYTNPDIKCPIIKELEIIGQCKIKDHTILIDDRRLFGRKGDWGETIKEEEILKKLKQINAKYDIHYDNGIQKNDVIIAEVT